MSKIPRPSPLPFRQMPITDDAKSAGLPVNQRLTRSQVRKLVPSTQPEVKPQIMVKKQLKNQAIPNAVPSSSKEPTIPTRPVTKYKPLNRSKTEPTIKIEGISLRRNVAATSKAKQAVKAQASVQDTKKIEAKAAPKVKKAASFRDRKPSVLEQPKRVILPSTSKAKSKVGEVKQIPAQQKVKTAEASKVTSSHVRKEPFRRLNRSKTESVIKLGNLKNKASKPDSQDKQKDTKAGKEKTQLLMPTSSNIEVDPLLKLKNDFRAAHEVDVKFHSPREEGHSGLKFITRKKKSLSLKLNLNQSRSPQTPEGAADSPVDLKPEEAEKM